MTLLGVAKAQEKTIYVDLDYARILRLPEGAQTLVIGNPLIADVTMLKNNRLMVVTGKSFGATNFIILDNSGSQVGNLSSPSCRPMTSSWSCAGRIANPIGAIRTARPPSISATTAPS